MKVNSLRNKYTWLSRLGGGVFLLVALLGADLQSDIIRINNSNRNSFSVANSGQILAAWYGKDGDPRNKWVTAELRQMFDGTYNVWLGPIVLFNEGIHKNMHTYFGDPMPGEVKDLAIAIRGADGKQIDLRIADGQAFMLWHSK